ncbi:MAG: pyridoxamine 5'-phosphate oxidase family protein [Nitrososphaeraceae archaeon]
MNEQVSTKPGVLSSEEINKLLSMTLIANLGTTDNDGTIHLLPMWFMRIGNEICIPTSHHTHKYRNLRARPHASVMIDVSKAGLDLKGVLISGKVKLVGGKEAQQINRSIHLKYVTLEARQIPDSHLKSSTTDDHEVSTDLNSFRLKVS